MQVRTDQTPMSDHFQDTEIAYVAFCNNRTILEVCLHYLQTVLIPTQSQTLQGFTFFKLS